MNPNQTKRKLNLADKIMLAICLLWLVSVLSQFRLGPVLASQPMSDYCAGAPECYPVDENGETVLEFGDLLKEEIRTNPAYSKPWKLPVDIDRLAVAVAHAETSNCSKGVAVTHNNCFGIRRGGKFVKYQSKEESFEDFRRTWQTYYVTFPTLKMADIWTGGDKPREWLNIVTSKYNESPAI